MSTKKKKDLQSYYKEMDQREHIYNKPLMWIGSDKSKTYTELLFEPEKGFSYTKIKYILGLFNIFKEVFVNAGDNVSRSRLEGIDPGKIEVTMTDRVISVRNYGKGIPIETRDDGMYIPEFIFGKLMTSSNYDENSTEIVSGTYGIGAKATNIFSKKFTVSVSNEDYEKKYVQTWTDNMTKVSKPKITKYSKKKNITEVTFEPDFERFKIEEFSYDMVKFVAATCAEYSMTKEIPIVFTCDYKNKKWKETFKFTMESFSKTIFGEKKHSFKYTSDNYKFIIVDDPIYKINLSYVNGMRTPDGGKHVDFILSGFTKYLNTFMKTKSIRKDSYNNQLIGMIVMLTDPKPELKGQFKSELVDWSLSPEPKINYKITKSWELYKHLLRLGDEKIMKDLEKKENKNTSKRVILEDVDDANLAGKKPDECTLFIVEGKSAGTYIDYYKSFYKDSKGNTIGGDYFGLMLLQGKPLNAEDADKKKLATNKTIITIKQLLGVKENKDYSKDLSGLRYNNVGILTDADSDGIHIQGLLLMMFYKLWPSILKAGIVKLYRTPIIRVQRNKKSIKFYTQKSYDEWKEKTPDFEKWTHSYFKGLASSTEKDIEEDYKDPNIVRITCDPDAGNSFKKAFKKGNDCIEKRKEWILNFVVDKLKNLEEIEELSISDLINESLILYSIESTFRAGPKMDGFNEVRRKIFFALRNTKKIKTMRAASIVAEKTAYKHGEANITNSIIGMTTNFVGSNNEPYFFQEAIFGTRKYGGTAAAPRYTFINKNWWTDYIFRKEDEHLLVRLNDEGQDIEYEQYYPILPTLLFNGITGISTGFSFVVLSYYPPQVAQWILTKIEEEENGESYDYPELIPWFRGFKGKTKRSPKGGVLFEGIFEHKGKDVIITEIPVGKLVNTYENMIKKMVEEKRIKTYISRSSKNTVYFKLIGWNDKEPPSLDNLKLVNKDYSGYKSFYVIDKIKDREVPVKFKDVYEFLDRFYEIRIQKYKERLDILKLKKMKEIAEIEERSRFVTDVIEGKIKVMKVKIEDLRKTMKSMNYKNLDLPKQVNTLDLTRDHVEKLLNDVKEIKKELEELKNTTPGKIWSKEIKEYLNAYKKYYKIDKFIMPEYQK